MEFNVITSNLREAIGKVISVVDKKNTRPILTYTKIILSSNQIEILATDLEVSAKIKIDTNSQSQGEFCVNAKNLYDILQVLPEGEIQFKLNDDNNLDIHLNEIHYKLLVYKSEDFPHLTFENIENQFQLKAEKLLEIIQKTSYAISNDETRLYLNGIYFQDIEGKLRAVATDGHRLALLNTEVTTNFSENLINGIIIPKKGINELKKIAETYHQDEIKISVDESFMFVNAQDKYFLSIRLIAREYPKYQAVIPNKTTYCVRIEKEVFLNAAKRIKIMSNEKSNGVRVKLDASKMTLSANHPSLGNAFETISTEYDGNEMEIGFNAKYLIEALNIIQDTEVILEINNELSPVIIRADKMPNYLSIIMPLKL